MLDENSVCTRVSPKNFITNSYNANSLIIAQGQRRQRSQKPLEPQLRVCVLCQSAYKFDKTVSFEQGLIHDGDFCAKCFN